MSLLLVLTGLFIVAILAIGIVWTIRQTRRMQPPLWTTAALGALFVGGLVGLYSGIAIRWKASDTTEYVGFPVPGMVLHLEDGRWVDYVSPIVVVSPFLDALIVASACLVPQFVMVLAIAARRRKDKCQASH